jgi:putative hydrolase of the HAD superfamily
MMRFTTIYFDLDATLYPESNGLWPAIRSRIDQFMHHRVGIPENDIPQLRRNYYDQYGTTLRGLQANYNIDPNEYLEYVHDLPLEKYLQPDPSLRSLLQSIPIPRWIFTNSDSKHVQRVLEILRIEDCFHGVIDVWALDPHCKPQVEAYNKALILSNETNPKTCAFLDDSIRNLIPARDLGFFTVLVGNEELHPSADRSLKDIKELRGKIPELWMAGIEG